MNEKLEAILFADFSELFKHRTNMKVSLMGFGVASDDGWFDLIYDLTKAIHAQLIKEHSKVPDQFYVIQIKEKYASLAYYITGASKDVHDLIHTAEALSTKTCETCGKPGKILCRGMWLKTLCPKCAKEQEFITCQKI